jgi:aromatic ring hydroxylase
MTSREQKARERYMGMLFNIPNNEDREIVALLNREFSGKRFARMQKHHKNKEKLFDANHHLRRVAWRFNLWPKKTPGDRAKGRWLERYPR